MLPVLAAVNNPAVAADTQICLFRTLLSLLVCRYPEVKLLDHSVKNFFSTIAAHFISPLTMHRVLVAPHPCQYLLFSVKLKTFFLEIYFYLFGCIES